MFPIKRRILIAVLLLIAGVGLVAQAGWAAPHHSPVCQTVPPRPTSVPPDGGGGDGDGDGEDGEEPPSPPPAAPLDVTATPIPTGPPLPTDTPTPTAMPTPAGFPNCRFGVASVNNPMGTYDTSGLNLGWYVTYSTSDASAVPEGVEFVRMVRVHQDKHDDCRDCYTTPYTYTVTPDADTLVEQVIASPGATWLIGNEPDRRDWETGRQDEMVPELYAQAYYEIGHLIRGVDPSAKIALAGVMQATPLRLSYLDQIWERYRSLYGRRLGDDVDIWNVHGYILREEEGSWGADIPAGVPDSQGTLYEIEDNANLDYFKEQIARFRTWMRDRGERDKPLYVTEYGVIMPPSYIPADRVRAFMSGTFDYMLDVTDVELGYPADDNRLVQRFLWYSLDDSSDDPARAEEYAGALFSSVTLDRLDLGDHMAAYIRNPLHTEANTRRVNLVVDKLEANLAPEVESTDAVTLTMRATIQNRGNTRTLSDDGIRIRFWDGRPGNPQSEVVGTQIIGDIYGCGYQVVVEQSLAIDLESAGEHSWFVDVETLREEESPRDNIGRTRMGDADRRQ